MAEKTITVTNDELIKALEGSYEEGEISSAFILDDGTVVSSDKLVNYIEDSSYKNKSHFPALDPDSFYSVDYLAKKSIEGSKQSPEELVRYGESGYNSLYGTTEEIVEPPFPPDLMAQLMELEETHAKSVKVKATDSLKRGYTLKNTVPLDIDGSDEEPAFDFNLADNCYLEAESVSNEVYRADLSKAQAFVETCNEVDGFIGTFHKAGLDYDAFGYCSIEVVRGADMRVSKIAHVPVGRMRVLKGWKGFVEEVDTDTQTYRHYLPFGHKVLKTEKDPILGTVSERPFHPAKDGDFDDNLESLEWNLIDAFTGEPTNDLSKSANEIIWIKNDHPNTIYYGYSDIIPALGALMGNVHIRQYFLNFFKHSAVPKFAVVVEGGKLAQPVMELIHQYFSKEIRTDNNTTLILNVPSMRGEVKVRFERLDSGQKEGDFLETAKDGKQCIMTAHGVSPAILGIADSASIGDGKNSSQTEVYKDRVVIPRQGMWEGVAKKLFTVGLGACFVALRFNPFDLRDKESLSRTHQTYLECGVLNINEVRDDLGLPPVKGGSRNFIKTRGGQILFLDSFADAGDFIDPMLTSQTNQVSSEERGSQNTDDNSSAQDTEEDS